MAVGRTKPPKCFNPVDFNAAAIELAALFDTDTWKFGPAMTVVTRLLFARLILPLLFAATFTRCTKLPAKLQRACAA